MIDDITVEELKQKIDAGEKFVFIDVRKPHEYEEFNLNATLIPLGTLPTASTGPLIKTKKSSSIAVQAQEADQQK